MATFPISKQPQHLWPYLAISPQRLTPTSNFMPLVTVMSFKLSHVYSCNPFADVERRQEKLFWVYRPSMRRNKGRNRTRTLVMVNLCPKAQLQFCMSFCSYLFSCLSFPTWPQAPWGWGSLSILFTAISTVNNAWYIIGLMNGNWVNE